MASPKQSTIKRLFAVSSNECAFPKCATSIIDQVSGKVLGEICHIKAQNSDGPRFDETQSETERHAFENLILLCPTHHTVIDSDIQSYSPERLIEMKSEHEGKSEKEYDYPDFLIQQLIDKLDITTKIFSNSNVVEGNQYAEVIQNITSPVEIKNRISYNEILPHLHEENTPLSKVISEILNASHESNDSELIELCQEELTGWPNPPQTESHHRIIEVYISVNKIQKAWGLTNDELWREFESRDDFVKMKMFYGESVPRLEQMINANKYNDPNSSYIHLEQKQGSLFPDLPHPEINVNIYAKGTMVHELLNRIRNTFSEKLIQRIK